MNQKPIIYQVFTRLFGNEEAHPVTNGDKASNGCGSFAAFTPRALKAIRELGATHIWYTGVIEHASQSAYPELYIDADPSSIVKGKAGSPYAIRDYYDVDPDLAQNPLRRMQEFEALVERTHDADLKVIIDFVPNHLARCYRSDVKPAGVTDFGVNDNPHHHFDSQNNFYYCVNTPFHPQFECENYQEYPAKATGNDCFHPSPSHNDWYETVKLNYGVDYTGGMHKHFQPIPDTWNKMLDILLFWADKHVDGFRCDMAEMVPVEFWAWVIPQIKSIHPDICFIAEIYQPDKYRSYLDYGKFDYIYDKVGLYDTLKSIETRGLRADAITGCWQSIDAFQERMLHFLENHDEQRITSDFVAGRNNEMRASAIVSALLSKAPFMLYFGQELGESGMDNEGYSGIDGRTTIFDYWCIDSIYRWYNRGTCDNSLLTEREQSVRNFYHTLLRIASQETAVVDGNMYDLTWMNYDNPHYDVTKQYAFIRHNEGSYILVLVNFDTQPKRVGLKMGAHVFEHIGLNATTKQYASDLLNACEVEFSLLPDGISEFDLPAQSGIVLKF